MIYRKASVFLVFLLAVMLLPSYTAAQLRGTAPTSGLHGGAGFGPNGRGRLGHAGRHHDHGAVLLYPFYDYYYDDYDRDYEPAAEERSRHEVVTMQETKATVPAAAPAAESLILENRNGEWVRISTGKNVPVESQYREPQANGSGSKSSSEIEPIKAPVKLPPAVVVFRDGHQEEIGRYVIQGNVLYSGADYWSTGSWTRKIAISDLDVPASQKLNAARGGSFNLPNRANEVVVRF